jgi:hypothetical protein
MSEELRTSETPVPPGSAFNSLKLFLSKALAYKEVINYLSHLKLTERLSQNGKPGLWMVSAACWILRR